MKQLIINEKIQKMPKVELHTHLGGCFARSDLWVLAQRYRGELTKEQFDKMFDFRSFEDFSATWKFKNSLVRTYDDFSFLMDGVVAYLKSENIIYWEPAIALFEFESLDPAKLLDIAALKLNESGILYSFIMDLIRGDGASRLGMQYDFYNSLAKDYPIRGVGLSGNEQKYGLSLDLIPIFAKAKADGYGVTIHAGENGSNSNIKLALDDFKPDRIAHANWMVNHNWFPCGNFEELGSSVHHEYVPSSMLYYKFSIDKDLGGIFYNPVSMPGYYLESMGGYYFSVSSDDPGMFGKSLSYILSALNLRDYELCKLMCMATTASFASSEMKKGIAFVLGEHWRDEEYWMISYMKEVIEEENMK